MPNGMKENKTRSTIMLVTAAAAVILLALIARAYLNKPPSAVSNSAASAASPFNCTGQNSNYDCYDAYYRQLVKADGVSSAFTDIKARYQTDSYVQSECHALMHVIGQSAALKYSSVSEAYSHGDEFCASGYYHGVMEGWISKYGRAQFLPQLNALCAGIADKSRYGLDYYNCNHGLGHSLMAYTDEQLFDSLKYCDTLIGSWEQASCHSGVFMENVIADFRNHVTHYLIPSQPLYPCTAVDQKYKQPCYLIQSSYVLKLHPGDFKTVFLACEGAEADFRDICYQSLGRDAAGTSVDEVSATVSRCDLGKNYDEQSNCVIGAVKDFVWHFHSLADGEKLCRALAQNLQAICLSTAKDYYATF